MTNVTGAALAHLAVAQVKVVHAVGEQNATQGSNVGVVFAGEEGVHAVRAPHVFVHPRQPLPPFPKPGERAQPCRQRSRTWGNSSSTGKI